jgi:hypothetical protein
LNGPIADQLIAIRPFIAEVGFFSVGVRTQSLGSGSK